MCILGGVNVFPQNDVKSATCEDGKVKLELSGGETVCYTGIFLGLI